MAWRDSRHSRGRLFFSITSITLGIAALVAISSFGDNLEQSIHDQSKALLGADLVIKSRRPLGKETLDLINSLGGEQSRQISFSSMVTFPKSGSTRLARVRALDGSFPFYGAMETVPESAARNYKKGSNALVADSLMLQFDAQVGDSINIGAHTFRIAGRLKKMPGETFAAGLIRPRVYIPMVFWIKQNSFRGAVSPDTGSISSLILSVKRSNSFKHYNPISSSTGSKSERFRSGRKD